MQSKYVLHGRCTFNTVHPTLQQLSVRGLTHAGPELRPSCPAIPLLLEHLLRGSFHSASYFYTRKVLVSATLHFQVPCRFYNNLL